jgi:hypothetical protein
MRGAGVARRPLLHPDEDSHVTGGERPNGRARGGVIAARLTNEATMKKTLCAIFLLCIPVTACGGGDDDRGGDPSPVAGDGSAGAPVPVEGAGDVGVGGASGIACDAPANELARAPEAIRRIAAERASAPPDRTAGVLWRYEYRGETVYYAPAPCCDFFSELYDGAGVLLCRPDGGITGAGDGTCRDFATERTGGCVVWADPRVAKP